MNNKCARCSNSLVESTVSWFNEDVICLECSEKEGSHPGFPGDQESIES